jgi:hypothetical protein
MSSAAREPVDCSGHTSDVPTTVALPAKGESASGVEHAFDRSDELVRVDGLRHVLVVPRLESPLGIFGSGVCCQGDRRNVDVLRAQVRMKR